MKVCFSRIDNVLVQPAENGVRREHTAGRVKKKTSTGIHATAPRNFMQGKREVLEFVVKRDANLGDFPFVCPLLSVSSPASS